MHAISTAVSAEAVPTPLPPAAEPPNPWIGRLPVFQSNRVWQPEDSPFQVLGVDLTHRCNMACKNCYIPNRHVPDMDAEWLRGVLVRLPHGEIEEKPPRIRLLTRLGPPPELDEDAYWQEVGAAMDELYARDWGLSIRWEGRQAHRMQIANLRP